MSDRNLSVAVRNSLSGRQLSTVTIKHVLELIRQEQELRSKEDYTHLMRLSIQSKASAAEASRASASKPAAVVAKPASSNPPPAAGGVDEKQVAKGLAHLRAQLAQTNPEHPDAQYKVHPNKPHSNGACYVQHPHLRPPPGDKSQQGASKQTKHVAVAASAQVLPQSDMMTRNDFMSMIDQRFGQLHLSLAAQMTPQHVASNQGHVQQNSAGPAQQQGPACVTCGYPGVHRNNVCYIANPEAAPTWRPGPKLPAHLKQLWKTNRHKKGLPPLEEHTTAVVHTVVSPVASAPPNHLGSAASNDLCVLVTKQACIEQHAPIQYHAVLASNAAQGVRRTPRSFARMQGGTVRSDMPPVAQHSSSDAQSSFDTAVWLQLYLGRDADVLHTVKTRNASHAGSSVLEPVEQSLLAFVPSIVDSQAWLANYNDRDVSLNYVVNRSPEEGISLTTPDGRTVLCQKLMSDDGSTTDIIEADFCHSIGLTWYPAAEISLRSAGYKSEDVLGKTPPVTVTLAKGTAHETSIQVSFLVLRGVQELYTVLLGKKQLQHHVDTGGLCLPSV
eukprot:jgi/Chrzof1/13456/UNPLg00539.t1